VRKEEEGRYFGTFLSSRSQDSYVIYCLQLHCQSRFVMSYPKLAGNGVKLSAITHLPAEKKRKYFCIQGCSAFQSQTARYGLILDAWI
jgi:hypothetical protein